MGRAPCCDKANVKRGPWSPEEDEKLKSYIEKHGTGGNWIALPHKIGLKRCGKSCRLRWLNYLRPNIRHGGFTEDEDNLICGLYIAIGSRWSIIAAQLPGRTDNDIKNYWNTKLKKKLLGRQRRQKQTKKAETGKGDQAWIDLYPQVPQLVLPPCLVQSRCPNSVDSGSVPPVDEGLVYNHLQMKNNRGKVGNFLYTSDGPCPPSQQLCNSSEVVLSPSIPLMESDLYGAYDEITRDGLSPLHTIDLMICRTGMFSPEIMARYGDADSIIQRYGLSDGDGLQRIMPQNWEFNGDS